MELINKNYYALGTVINLAVKDSANENDLEAGYHLIQRFEDKLTVNRNESEVMSINHQAGISPVIVSRDTYDLIKRAVLISRKHLGFNVAIGPLVKLWKIGFKGANKPNDDDIKKRLSIIDPEKIILNDDESSVFLQEKGMEIDLGGIAKGYIADQIKELWKNRGVKTGIIDLGGNVLLLGPSLHEDRMWNVGVQNPIKPREVSLGVIHTTEKSIGTSGIYERKLIIDNHEYHHMFDSRTGYPIKNNLASVTIISDKSIDGEIWSTIGFYQGIKQGLDMIEKKPGIEAIFITKDLKTFVTSGLNKNFKRL